MSTARTLTLADVALPRAGVLSNALLVVGASLLTALAAQLAIPVPWSPVPITGQTFAVLLSGAVLGMRDGRSSPRRSTSPRARSACRCSRRAGPGSPPSPGPTGGYLFAFPLAAALTGALAERGWDRHFGTMIGGDADRQRRGLRARPDRARAASCPRTGCSPPGCFPSSRATWSSRRSPRSRSRPRGAGPGPDAERIGRVTIQNVAVLGAGLMGRGIAYVSALGGFRTILEDASGEALDAAAAEISALLEKGVATGKVPGRGRRRGAQAAHHARGRSRTRCAAPTW